MRFTIISLAIFMTAVTSYSAEASLENAVKQSEGSSVGHIVEVKGNSGLISRSERRSFTSRSRAVTRANLQRRNGSLLPDIVLPSITSAQPAPAPVPARPIPQAVSYPASVPAAAAVAAAPLAQNYYTPQPVAQSTTPQVPAAQNYAPQQPAVQNYAPQQPAVPSQSTTLPSLTLPTLVQAPKEKEDDDNDNDNDDDDDDEEEEDEDEEDEEDFDADDLVTRRRR